MYINTYHHLQYKIYSQFIISKIHPISHYLLNNIFSLDKFYYIKVN